MATPKIDWLRRHRGGVMGTMIVLLLLVVLAQGFMLFQQRSAIRATEVRSAELLDTFLRGDTVQTSGAAGVAIRLQNVQFRWSDRVYIDTGDMALRAAPVRGAVVDFDALESFRLHLQQSVVRIRPEVLEGMFNESVFNYPHSKLRDLEVTLTEDDDERAVRVKGKVNIGIWIPFAMNTRLSVDKQTNTLVIDVDDIKVLGILPATGLIKLKPLRLEKMLSLPPNKSLMVDGNRLMVKPFGLFPPPRVDGTMSEVAVDSREIRLTFAGDPIPAPGSPAKSYVYLKGGTSQFGNIRMLDTDILVLDQDPSDPFVFSLARYNEMIPRSQIIVRDTKSARVVMPDL